MIRKGLLLTLLLLTGMAPAQAELRIFACEPEWAALVQELGGERVSVFSATTAQQDPHRIEARPSLIAKMRQADLVVCTGAELEVGWVPMLQRQAGNARVQPGNPGYFEAAAMVERLEIPATLDRAQGDVHAAGNPHVHTDPRRVGAVAPKLTARLAALDAPNAAYYGARLATFQSRWQQALARWSQMGAPLRGMRAVAHHRNWVYLYDWLGIRDAGTLEPKPGIPPASGHLAELKGKLAREPAQWILLTPYQDVRAAQWLAAQTGARVVTLPYTVGGNAAAKDLFALYDDTLARLLGTSR